MFKIRQKLKHKSILLLFMEKLLQTFLPNMIEKNHGHVVAVASLLAILTSQYATVYSATKVGIRGNNILITVHSRIEHFLIDY